MLKTRLVSAAVMVPLVVGGILLLPTPVLAAVLALIIAGGLWEWSRMVPLHTGTARTVFLVTGLALAGLIWSMSPAAVIAPLLLAAFLWWLWVLFWLTHFEITAQPSTRATALKLAGGYLVMLPAWTALIVLHERTEDGPLITLFLLVVVWLADSGAYFAGRRWGKRKLAPVVSPGKTWEGVYGAVATSGIFALVAGLFYSHSVLWTAGLVVVMMVTVMFSIAGDLLESLMKRQCGIKDSGNIIPGHGGILDRIDSLTAAAPVFLLGLHWMQL